MLKNYSSSGFQSSNLSLTYSSGKKVRELVKDYNIASSSYRKKYEREDILRAFNEVKISQIVDISRYTYKTNPLYTQYINYYSTIYPYRWAVFPRLDSAKIKKSTYTRWYDVLNYVEMINPELLFIDIARRVLIEGSCYIAIKDENSYFGVQFLPRRYCRSNTTYRGRPVVEFNVTYFDSLKPTDKKEALKTFPSTVVSAYKDWQNMKDKTSEDEWQALGVDYSYKFTLRPDDLPLIYGVVLDLLDVQDAKDITMFKIEQEVSKILVQKFGVDNQGQPVIALPELKQFQRDTSTALASIPGLDVMTTYADVSVENLQKATSSSSTETPISQIGQDAYEAAGVSSKLINSDNAGTLGKSIQLNEATMTYLLLQLRQFLQVRIDVHTASNKESYTLEMPEVSRFNWKDKYDSYIKDNLLNSKMLAQVISGRRQSDIMAAYFFEEACFGGSEEDGQSSASSSSSSDSSSDGSNDDSGSNASATSGSDTGEVGRPELPDDQKSEKTLQNRESL